MLLLVRRRTDPELTANRDTGITEKLAPHIII